MWIYWVWCFFRFSFLVVVLTFYLDSIIHRSFLSLSLSVDRYGVAFTNIFFTFPLFSEKRKKKAGVREISFFPSLRGFEEFRKKSLWVSLLVNLSLCRLELTKLLPSLLPCRQKLRGNFLCETESKKIRAFVWLGPRYAFQFVVISSFYCLLVEARPHERDYASLRANSQKNLDASFFFFSLLVSLKLPLYLLSLTVLLLLTRACHL